MAHFFATLPAWPFAVVVVALLLTAVALHGYGTAKTWRQDP